VIKAECQQEYAELIERLKDECLLMIKSAENIPSHDDPGYSSVSNDSISKINDILDSLTWLENSETKEELKMKQFRLIAYKTRRFIMTVEAESQERAIEIGDGLRETEWESYECDSLPIEVKEVEEIDKEDEDD
jgi:flagellin-specific chaperone FliS